MLSDDEQDAIITLVSQNADSLAKTKSEKLAALQRDIDLVTLVNLIDQYESMIEKNLKEDQWQKFLNDNPFILSLAFGYPIIKVRDQAYVGGRKIGGEGDKIADFFGQE